MVCRALVHQQRYLPAVQPTRYSPVPCLGQLLMLSLQFAALLPTPFGNVEFVALKLVDALIEDTEKDFQVPQVVRPGQPWRDSVTQMEKLRICRNNSGREIRAG